VHHGRIVKRRGDGAVVEFRSVVDAVNCAIEVQRAMVERNAEVAPDKSIEFRIGIHLGDLVEEADGDLMRDSVNIAARLEGVAKPGAISPPNKPTGRLRRGSIFKSAISATRNSRTSPSRCASIRCKWDYSLRRNRQSVEGKSEEKPPPRPALSDKPSIAVLPFANMSGDAEQEYFVDGI
jgi:adenylate cyclase